MVPAKVRQQYIPYHVPYAGSETVLTHVRQAQDWAPLRNSNESDSHPSEAKALIC